jgi:hypothetical protein
MTPHDRISLGAAMGWFKSAVLGAVVACAAFATGPQPGRASILDWFQQSPLSWTVLGTPVVVSGGVLRLLTATPVTPGDIVGGPLEEFVLFGDAALEGMVQIGADPPAPLAFGGTMGFLAIDVPPLPPYSVDTEMLMLDLAGSLGGPIPVMIRESPTLPSPGKLTVDSSFFVDSFFDVFVELSIDNGLTWIPQNEANGTHFSNIPEPLSAALLGFGLIGIAGLRRRIRPS